MDIRTLPMMKNPEQMRAYGSGSPIANSQAASASEDLFSDLFEAELAKVQTVIRAEEVVASLDGSPDDFPNTSKNLKMYTDVATSERESGANHQKTGSVGSTEVMEKINRIASRYGVSTDIVREVVRAESNFNPNATSHAGAKGLMQLMDGTARMLRVGNSYDPEQNIAGGTQYLRDLLHKYDGNVKVALAAYNAGPGRVDQLDIDTNEEFDAKASLLPRETQKYVAKIYGRLYE